MMVVTAVSLRGTAVSTSPMAAIQVIFCTARPGLPLVGRTVTAVVGSAGTMVMVSVASFFILPVQQLPHGSSPLVFSCAGFLIWGEVAVFGMVMLASASGVAARLLLASG